MLDLFWNYSHAAGANLVQSIYFENKCINIKVLSAVSSFRFRMVYHKPTCRPSTDETRTSCGDSKAIFAEFIFSKLTHYNYLQTIIMLKQLFIVFKYYKIVKKINKTARHQLSSSRQKLLYLLQPWNFRK